MKRYVKDPTEAMLDKLWEYKVKERAGFACEVQDPAGCCEGLHACHIISRRHQWTRHDLRNGVAACPRCHDDAKIEAWLKRSERRRYAWIRRQRIKIHPNGAINIKKVLKKLEAA